MIKLVAEAIFSKEISGLKLKGCVRASLCQGVQIYLVLFQFPLALCLSLVCTNQVCILGILRAAAIFIGFCYFSPPSFFLLRKGERVSFCVREKESSVTRLCDLLDFGQLFKAFNLINLSKSHTFLRNFVKVLKSIIFPVKSF